MTTQVAWQPSLDLRSAPTVSKFIRSNAKQRLIIGPVGSGKSLACCAEIFRRALEQEPSPVDNIRYFKALIVRNTLPELKSTTIETWRDFADEDILGPIKVTPPMEHLIFREPANGEPGLHLKVEFLGLDQEKHVRKLLSYEGTLIWFNECREIRKDLIDAASARVGRYPSKGKKMKVDATWKGIIMDTNPPDDDHWIVEMMDEAPYGWDFFQQPPGVVEVEEFNGMWRSVDAACPLLTVTDPEFLAKACDKLWVTNPAAENLQNLPIAGEGNSALSKHGYYLDLVPGKDLDWIQQYLQGRIGFIADGRPVTPEFDQQSMVGEFPILDGVAVEGGFDIGGGTLHSFCVLAQRHPSGMWLIQDEIFSDGEALETFAQQVRKHLAGLFPGHDIGNFWADPAGAQKDGHYKVTAFDFLKAEGIPVFPVETNDLKVRTESARKPMMRLIQGGPGVKVHRRCRMLVKALSGGWNYRKMPGTGGSVYHKDVPDKNRYSHAGDAFGYLMMGTGEARLLRGKNRKRQQKPFRGKTKFNVFK